MVQLNIYCRAWLESLLIFTAFAATFFLSFFHL